jgi:hypothetical protein
LSGLLKPGHQNQKVAAASRATNTVINIGAGEADASGNGGLPAMATADEPSK